MPDLHTDINIHETINSGQIFLWENYKDAWFVIDGHDIIMVKQIPFEITTFSKKPKNFFREDDNYGKILKNITKDKIVKMQVSTIRDYVLQDKILSNAVFRLLFLQIQIYLISECDFKNYV